MTNAIGLNETLLGSDALEWDLDATETSSAWGHEVLQQEDFSVECSFCNEGGELRRLTSKVGAGVPFTSVEGLQWTRLVLSGVLELPPADGFQAVGADPKKSVPVVTVTTHGFTRRRWQRSLDCEPGKAVLFEFDLPRSELRGRLEIAASIALASSTKPQPGFAHRAFTRVAVTNSVFVDVDRIDPILGSSMPIVWTDFGKDKALYRLEIVSNDDGDPIVKVLLNNSDDALRVVLDSTDGDEARVAARRLLQSLIATEVLAQLARLAKQRKTENGNEDAFYQRLRSTLHRKGVPDEAIDSADTLDGQIDINYRIQNNLQAHSLASKLVRVVGADEEAQDDIQA